MVYQIDHVTRALFFLHPEAKKVIKTNSDGLFGSHLHLLAKFQRGKATCFYDGKSGERDIYGKENILLRKSFPSPVSIDGKSDYGSTRIYLQVLVTEQTGLRHKFALWPPTRCFATHAMLKYYLVVL